jgi:hypothetical protein
MAERADGPKAAVGGKGGWRPAVHSDISHFPLGYHIESNLNFNSNLNPHK